MPIVRVGTKFASTSMPPIVLVKALVPAAYT